MKGLFFFQTILVFMATNKCQFVQIFFDVELCLGVTGLIIYTTVEPTYNNIEVHKEKKWRGKI